MGFLPVMLMGDGLRNFGVDFCEVAVFHWVVHFLALGTEFGTYS
jgi:hypothetical protein